MMKSIEKRRLERERNKLDLDSWSFKKSARFKELQEQWDRKQYVSWFGLWFDLRFEFNAWKFFSWCLIISERRGDYIKRLTYIRKLRLFLAAMYSCGNYTRLATKSLLTDPLSMYVQAASAEQSVIWFLFTNRNTVIRSKSLLIAMTGWTETNTNDIFFSSFPLISF